MPFFCNFMNNNKKRSETLQVRIPEIKKLKSRKRVFFSASASLTLEASLVLPLFLYAGVILMTLFQVMDVHRRVQAEAEHICESIGQAVYMSKYAEESEFFSAVLAYEYAEFTLGGKLKQMPVQKVSLGRSRLLTDGETMDLIVDYEISLPFSVFGLKAVKQTNRSFRRAWVGEEGKYKAAEDGREDTTIVYVGKNSTRYHISSTCHYLYNDLTAVPANDIGSRRNKEGRTYSPCARCENEIRSTVYIMPSGRHYHSTPSCSAINAYVSEAVKSEVEYMGGCSYCSGKNR